MINNIRFLAVDPHWREYKENGIPRSLGIPSAGLAYVIAAAKEVGATCVGVEHFFTEKKQRAQSLIDFFQQEDVFIERVIEIITKENCQMVLITTTTGSYHLVLKMIDKLSNLPIKVVIGGSGITVSNLYSKSKNLFFTKPWAHLITVQGEGEIPIKEIVLRLRNGQDFRNIPGATYVDNGCIVDAPLSVKPELHSSPIADYSDFNLENFFPTLLVTHSRGCSGRCTFCDEKDVFHGLRFRSTERILTELKTFHEKYNIRCFKWTDSSFSASEKEVINICDFLMAANLNLHWVAFARICEVLKFQNSTMELMRKAKCIGLHFGFETFEKCVLEQTMKGYLEKSQAWQVTQKLRDCGMKVIGSFQIGFGSVDESSIADSVEYGANLQLDVYNYHAAVPPIKQMEDPDENNVSQLFRIWNNDPCIPPNLYSEYGEWHRERYGTVATMGRHTPMKQFLDFGKVVPQPAAYNLPVNDNVIASMLEKAMCNKREANEYQLFQQLGIVS